MICLDTNYLIRGLERGSAEAQALVRWHRGGESIAAASIAWYEFLCGPVTEAQVHAIKSFLSGGLIPFESAHATEAARLFNAVGRPRRLRVDSMIAAMAIRADARLATRNPSDFQRFVPYGLQLIP